MSAPLSAEERDAAEFLRACCIPWLHGRAVGVNMIRINNLYGLYELGRTLQSLDEKLSQEVSLLEVGDLCRHAMRGLILLRRDDVVPVKAVRVSAEELIKFINLMLNAQELQNNLQRPINPVLKNPIRDDISRFQAALSEELRQLPLYCVDSRGSLSIDHLVDGASIGYRALTLNLLDQFTRQEIDEAGRCLAFERATACGFHILRSVEIAVKGYLHAAKGELPKMNKRNWGEYIVQLEAAGASTDLIDLLRILKTKRNPLMHPQDNLDIDEAINLFCVSRAVTDSLIDDVITKNLEAKFSASLAALPRI